MQAVRLTKVAELENISLPTAHARYKHILVYVAGAGRGGKIAVVALENLSPALSPAAEEFSDAAIKSASVITVADFAQQDFIQQSKHWYATAEKLAGYLDCAVNAVHARAGRENWDFMIVAGAKKYYNVSSLPFEAQIKFRYELQAQIEAKQASANAGLYQLASESMRRRADQRLQILKDWQTFRRQAGRGNTLKLDQDFIVAWNLQHDDKISRPSLHRWYQGFCLDGLDGLIDKYDRKAHRQAEFDPKAKAYLETLYLDQVKRDMYSCYQNLVAVAKTENWLIPSYGTCARHLKKISRQVVTFLREGKKAFEDKAFPSILRDEDSIQVGEIYVADDRLADISFGEGKAGDRIWTTAVMDMRSKKILAIICAGSNDAQNVLDAFYTAFMEHIPHAVYLDNGSNYKEVAANNPEEGLPKSLQAPLLTLLGKENIHWALPGNARTKPIERQFLNMAKMHDKNLPGYTGMNVLNRPEGWYLQRENGEFLSVGIVVQFIKHYFFNIHNNRAIKGGLSPNQMWAEHFSRQSFKRAQPEYLRHHLLRTHPQLIKLRTNGVQFGKDAKKRNCYYWDEALQTLAGNVKEVWVKYNAGEPHHIWIYRPDGTPICEVPIHKFSGVPILRGGDKVGQYHAAKRKAIKEAQAYKARLQDIHQLNLTDPAFLMQRGDVQPEPELNVDKNTGEIIEQVTPHDLKIILPAPAKRLKEASARRGKMLKKFEMDFADLPAPATRVAVEDAWQTLEAILPS